MYKDSLYSVRKYFQSIYEVFSKSIWRTVIQQETNKPVSERGKEPFLTGLPCDYVRGYKEDTLVLCFVVIQNSSPLCLLWQCIWRCLFSRCLDRQAAENWSWEGWGCLGRWRTPCGGLWDCCIHLCSSLLFPCQDYEEAVLQLLEGAAWEEALRLVREVLSSFSCAGCWGR